jgi:hypothetical protein
MHNLFNAEFIGLYPALISRSKIIIFYLIDFKLKFNQLYFVVITMKRS